MATKYFNVKDFAERAGVSKQSIYKRLNKPNDPIQKYVSMVNNHVAISMDAIESLFKKTADGRKFKSAAETPSLLFDETDVAADRHYINNMVSSMMDVLDVLKIQLEQKDRQIESLQQNLSDCLDIIQNKKEHEL